MESVSIAIVSEDHAYKEALGMSLLSACRNLEINTFTCREFVKAWAEYNGSRQYYEIFDMVLWAGSEIGDAYGENIVYLAEKASMARRDFRNRKFCLYKYSSAQTMVAAIFEIYGCLTGRQAVCLHVADVRLVAFASWMGGSGCSTISMAVAQEMCRFHGMRVLYLSLEEIESTGTFIRYQAGVRSVGEYLYRLFRGNRNEDNIPFMDAYVVRDTFGVEAFAPAKGRNPLKNLSEREMQRFLSAIVDSGRYNAVVIDVGCCLAEPGIASLQMAEKVGFITCGDSDRSREDQYISHIICNAGETILDKSIRINNMADLELVGNEKEENISYMENNTELVLEGDFGEDIRRITSKLVNECL